MADYSPNLNLYLPSRNDSDISVDTSLTDNFNKIDTHASDVTAQLAEKAQQSDLDALSYSVRSPLIYGQITLPSDFPALPCGIYRDTDGIIKNNMNFSQYTGGTVLYVDKVNGSDTTGTGTTTTPYKTIQGAMTFITTSASATSPSYVIRVKSTNLNFNRDESFSNSPVINGKTVAIIPDDTTTRIRLSTHQTGLTWTQDGTNTWKTSRSNTYGVYDLRKTDVYGVPIPVPNVSTLSACQGVSNTWYTDGTTVWVCTSDGLSPTDANFIISVAVSNKVTLTNGAKLYMQNIDNINGQGSNGFAVIGDPSTLSGEFCANNCKFVGGYIKTVGVIDGNAFAGQQLKRTYLFNCLAAYSGRDGFNHHFDLVPTASARQYLVMEYGCTSYNNGLNDIVDNNNNCFTCHEGVNTMRINAVGYNSTGPILADVTGCYSICYDCNMRGTFSNGGAFQFANSGATNGKAIMVNCGADGGGVYEDITGDVPIQLHNVKAKKIDSGLTVTYI